jgi:WD40 repeat protein
MSETHQAIDLEDVEAVGNVDQALATYYADCVGATAVETGVSERTIRDWFEHELVTPEGIRGQVLRGPQETGAAGQRAVRLLTDAHLVRAESRHGATWYELAHDRLIEPVVDDNARWREEHLTDLERLASWWDQNRRPDQALLAASDIDGAEQWMTANTDAVSQVEREFVAASREAAEQAERERRANRRTRRWLIVAVVGCVLAAGFAGWAGLAQRRAEDLSAATEVTALAGRAADAAAFDIDLSLLLARRAASDPDGAASDRTIMTSLQRAVDQSPVVTVLRGHGPATDVDYSANGQVIATSHIGASDDGSVVVWDVSSGKGQALTPPKAGLVGDSLDLSPDGSQVAAVASNGNIVTWDLSAADPAPASIVAHEHNDPYRIAYSPDGSRIASVGHSPGLAVVDLTGRPKPVPGAAPWRGGRPRDFGTAESDTVDGWDVDWTPDGEQLIVAEADGVVSVWDGGTGQHLRDLHDHETTPNAVDVSGSGTLVASATDALVVVNDIATGEVVYRWDNVGGTSDISFSSDWTRLVVTDEFGTAAVVDPSASAVLRWVTATGSSLVSVDVDPSNPGRAVVASESGDPAVWNVSAGHSQVMSDAEPLPGGGVVTTSYDGSVTLWSPDLYPTPLAAASSRDSIEDAAVSESGGLLAVARSSGAVEVWTLPGGRQRLARRFGEGSARSVSLSPDGRYVAAGGSNGSVLVWDIDAGRVLHRLEEMHTQPVVSLDLGTDSGELVSASPDGTAVIWDLEARPQRRVIRLASAPDVVAWSRSGTTVAVAGEDGMLQFIDPDSGRQRPLHDAASEGHARTVHDIAFDVSGDRLVSGGADNAVIVWDVTSRRATTQYQHSAPAYRVAFSEDGQQVLVTDTSQIPHVVYLDRGELLEAAEKKVARTLTPQECDRYLGDDADCPRSE